MQQPIHLIVNPISGRLLIRRRLAQLQRDARKRNRPFEIHHTAGPGDAARLARELAAEPALVVAVGGDGTVRDVIAGAAGLPGQVAVLPAGTENLIAKEFGYRRTRRCFWNVVDNGRPQDIDVGMCNGRPFVAVVGVGFDGLAVEHLHRVREGHITHLHYMLPIIRSLTQYQFPPIRVTADDEPFFEGRGLAFVGNITRYAIGLRILQRARPDDGLLDVCVVPCGSYFQLAAQATRTLLRRHVTSGKVAYAQCRRVHIEADAPLSVQFDGDVAPRTPIDLSLMKDRATLRLPPRAALLLAANKTH